MKYNFIIYLLYDNNYNYGVLEMKFIRNFFLYLLKLLNKFDLFILIMK